MTHRLANNQHSPHSSPTQTISSLGDVESGVDQRLVGLLDSLPEALVCLDRQGRVTYLNQQAEHLLRQPRAALLGQRLWEACPEAPGATFYRQDHAAEEPPTAFQFEEFSPSLNKWFAVRACPLPHGTAVSFQDITRHKRIEAELFTLASIVESSDDAILSKTLEGLVLSWNSGAERLYGYNAQEMIGRSISILVPDDRRQELAAITQRLAEGQRVDHFETVRRRKDGRLIDVSITISPVKDFSGKIVGDSTIARDITERKRMQEQLYQSEQRFRALIEQSSDAIVLVDPNGMVLYTSPATTRLLGYTPDELVGRNAFELIHPDDLETTKAVLTAIVREPGKSLRAEYRARCKDGSFCWLEGTGTNLLTDPSVGAIVGNYRDITERKQTEERQRLLSEASAVLVSSLDHQITLQEIAHLIVPAFADYCRIALVDEQQQIKEIAVHHMDPEKVALVGALYDYYKDRASAPYGLQKLLQTGQPELLSNVSKSAGDAIQGPPELRSILKTLDLQSYMGVPLLAHGKTIGAITFSSVQPHRFYAPDVMSFAQELARRIALVLENARLHREAQVEIAERKRVQERQRVLQERILALATTDPVTGLPNDGALIALLDQELERAQQYQRSFSLLFLDLDHFKSLNDGYGHVAGDALLGEFVDLVQSKLRGLDTLGRWGGEEFVALLPGLDGDEALALAAGVRAAVAASTFHVGGGIHLTCSIGVASYPVHAQEREGLLGAADRAMYGAKRFGRNQVRVAHDPALLALYTASHLESGREEATLVGMAEALVTLVEARDHLTGYHSHQVADLVLQLALALGWPATQAQMLALAARLHDVGKVAVPDTVLQKPGALTQEEWDLMCRHPVVGAEVLSHIPALRPLAPVVRAHHERWDGQGYPDQLAGEAIPLGARILRVVDAYLAMIVDRPYRQACAPAVALVELGRCAGSQFDPQVVEALTLLLRPLDASATRHA